ncbi:MAG: hypothetical protein IEMM0006_1752 [bacterium]|nr:MAG: hypothetical protein IEMM0006_1752 [bacterium]
MTRLLKRINFPVRKKPSLFFVNVLLLLAALSFFNLSCSKYPSKVGADLLPNNSLSMHYKKGTFTAYSRTIDTTRSNNMSVSILGSIKDPVFGLTDAGFYSKVLPISEGQRFGTNPVTDSLVLQLYYANVYGDTNAVLHLHVYEMKDDISIDSIYYSNRSVAVYPTDYADMTFRPDKNKIYILNKLDTLKNVLRINLSHLSNALGNKLLNADTTILDSNLLFMDYFRGLYLKTDPVSSGGALASFLTGTRKTILMLYYHNDTADSLTYAYVLSASTAKINHYRHDFNVADQAFKNQVINGDTTLGQKLFYIQGLAGVKSVIKFPHIRDLNKLGKVGINEAKLILPGAETPPFLGAPAELSLIRIKNDSTYAILPDESEGANYFGGKYNAADNSYSFRITHYIESLIKDSTKVDNGLVLFIKSGVLYPERFIFNGPQFAGDSTRRARLDIFYTIVK